MSILSKGLSLITGGVGDLLGGFQQQTQARNSANNQMSFQKMMSDTSYQRGVADLKKAGLNPILAAGGGGASSPGGAGAPMSNPASGLASSAKQSQMLQKEIDLIDQQKATSRREELYKIGLLDNVIQQTNLSEDIAAGQQISNYKSTLQIPEMEAMADMWKTGGEGMKWLEKSLGFANSAKGLLPGYKSFFPLKGKR